jgi:hypothetical protein
VNLSALPSGSVADGTKLNVEPVVTLSIASPAISGWPLFAAPEGLVAALAGALSSPQAAINVTPNRTPTILNHDLQTQDNDLRRTADSTNW